MWKYLITKRLETPEINNLNRSFDHISNTLPTHVMFVKKMAYEVLVTHRGTILRNSYFK